MPPRAKPGRQTCWVSSALPSSSRVGSTVYHRKGDFVLMTGARDRLCDPPGLLASEPWAACLGPGEPGRGPGKRGTWRQPWGWIRLTLCPQRARRGARLGPVSAGQPGLTWSRLSRASPSLKPAGEWELCFQAAPCAPWVSLADVLPALSPAWAPLGRRRREGDSL